MTFRLRRLHLAALFVVASSLPTFAAGQTTNQQIDQLLGDHTKYEAAITKLQKAVATHDAPGVAALVSYPIRVKIKGKNTLIKSTKTFVKNYDAIMTPKITDAVTKQDYEKLFVNATGIMFGDGQVWVNGVCKDKACKNFDAKVITIQNGPK